MFLHVSIFLQVLSFDIEATPGLILDAQIAQFFCMTNQLS